MNDTKVISGAAITSIAAVAITVAVYLAMMKFGG